MNVSELARRTGIRPSAIRFYEAEGVLPAPERQPNGYRQYGEADYCRLRVFVTLRSLGVEPRESGRLAQLCAAGECDEMEEQLLPRIGQRRAEIASARAELDRLDAELAVLEHKVRANEPYELRFRDGQGEDPLCAPSQC
jgi:MerR family transcriptional regulator, copper efflux regulator